jgi:A/G-specific adenine glycosylase
VPASISIAEERETALTLLSCLVRSSSPLDTSSTVEDTTRSGAVRLVKIERVGDVLHVFSHIRKTYRVQWVVLEGGGVTPPELAPRMAGAKVKVKGSSKAESIWIRLGEVENAK